MNCHRPAEPISAIATSQALASTNVALPCEALDVRDAERCLPRLRVPPLPAEWELVAHLKAVHGIRCRTERAALAKVCLLSRARGYCSMSQAKLAELVEVSERTLRRWIAKWRAAGLIRTVDRQGTHHTFVQWEALQLPLLRAVLAGPTGHRGRSRLLTIAEPPQQRPAAKSRATRPAISAKSPAPRQRSAGSCVLVGAEAEAPGTAVPETRFQVQPAGTAVPETRFQVQPSRPSVEAPAALLAAVLREHGIEAEAVVQGVLAAPEAQQHPAAAVQALEALTTYGRRDVRTTLGRLFRWLVREAIAGRDQRNVITEGPRANTPSARITRAIENAEQLGRLDEAGRLRAAQVRAAAAARRQIDALERQDPGHQRAQDIIDAARAGLIGSRASDAPLALPRGPCTTDVSRFLPEAVEHRLRLKASLFPERPAQIP